MIAFRESDWLRDLSGNLSGGKPAYGAKRNSGGRGRPSPSGSATFGEIRMHRSSSGGSSKESLVSSSKVS